MSSSAALQLVDCDEGSGCADRGQVLAAAEISRQSNELLEASMVSLAARIDAAVGEFLDVLAEFDRREAWREWGMVSGAHWLTWHCGIALGDCS